MGLFNFIKEIGNKLFNREGEAAEKISAHLLENNPGIEQLGVTYKDGIVTLSGIAASAEAAQKAILMAGNVKGVTDVISKLDIANVSGSAVKASDDANVKAMLEPENVQYYIIESGDTLSRIAQKFYKNAGQYTRIFEANREVIRDPDLIYPGQKIRIPLDQ
ncbi:Peptidoglycan-binding lysin domain protein [Candidatus Methylobacter favarea]|uniref:Peptidoglycan-binding lysin domain protein n=1 Tax=Candidatus Methylobacter favarea TaxID=2707345 RepID=A0A8S0WAT8_9GAMM|nr:peptidoglycan-binding protein LysM [Candidatus Methylobacter favarea]CAA9891049.1 Peptidoglycan-binding lysin domain protein [Candidatus Methylobacter favarea]